MRKTTKLIATAGAAVARGRGILANLDVGTGEELTRERLGRISVPVTCVVS
jgi:hypothetical protein